MEIRVCVLTVCYYAITNPFVVGITSQYVRIFWSDLRTT